MKDYYPPVELELTDFQKKLRKFVDILTEDFWTRETSNEYVARLQAAMDDLETATSPKFVYFVWSIDADSYHGTRYFESVHKTLSGAVEAIPERFRKESDMRPLRKDYVANFIYYAVERKIVNA
jgi:hypothetical protein